MDVAKASLQFPKISAILNKDCNNCFWVVELQMGDPHTHTEAQQPLLTAFLHLTLYSPSEHATAIVSVGGHLVHHFSKLPPCCMLTLASFVARQGSCKTTSRKSRFQGGHGTTMSTTTSSAPSTSRLAEPRKLECFSDT